MLLYAFSKFKNAITLAWNSTFSFSKNFLLVAIILHQTQWNIRNRLSEPFKCRNILCKICWFHTKISPFPTLPTPLISITYYCCKSKWNISQQLTLLFRTPFCRCFLWFFPNPWVLPPPLNNHVPDRKYLTKYVNDNLIFFQCSSVDF